MVSGQSAITGRNRPQGRLATCSAKTTVDWRFYT
jgi:hypothetical protein